MADYYGTDKDEKLSQQDLALPDWTNIFGGEGNDTISGGNVGLSGGIGNDVLKGESRFTTAIYWDAPNGVIVDLVTGLVQDGYGTLDRLESINFIQGSGKGDRFIGNSQNNSFWARSRFDFVDGGSGIDEVRITIDNSSIDPLFERLDSGWLIRYGTVATALSVVETKSVEILSIYRGSGIFENWDLRGATARKLLIPAGNPELAPYFEVNREQWKVTNWGIETLTFTENAEGWYYPTQAAKDYRGGPVL